MVNFDSMFQYLIIILVSTALAGTLFTAADLSAVTGAPAWVVTLAPILVGVFLIRMWYVTSSKQKR